MSELEEQRHVADLTGTLGQLDVDRFAELTRDRYPYPKVAKVTSDQWKFLWRELAPYLRDIEGDTPILPAKLFGIDIQLGFPTEYRG